MNTLYDDFRASFHSIWHRRWLALIVAWAICLVGWLVIAMIPNSYESHARISVQLSNPLATQMGIGDGDRKRDIDRVRDTLTSTAHLERVIRSTALGESITSPKQMESAVAGLGKSIKVTSDQENLFEISASSGISRLSDAQNAHLSKQIVGKMIEIFRDENANNNATEQKQSADFLDQQLAMRAQQLSSAEQRRVAFEAANPDMAQGGVSVIQRLESARSEERSIDGDIAAASSALASVNGQMAGTPQTVSAAGGPGGTKGALYQIQGELASMRAKGLTENHPDVIAARNQVAALKQQLASEGNNPTAGGVPNPAYSSLESLRADRQANIQALQARRGMVEQQLAQVTALQATNPELVSQAQTISRDYDVLKQQYDKLLNDREAVRLRGDVENAGGAAKFSIIDPPTTPRKPTAPNRPVLLFVVLLAGLGAGLGVAFAIGELRSTFATTGKLERSVGLPVLGAISQALSAETRAGRAKKVVHFYAATAALGGLFAVLVAMEFIQRGMVA